MLTELLQAVLSLDETLAVIATQYGPWLYVLLFAVIFAETGLVVFPFLPGDSMLFIAGTVVASAGLDVHLLVVLLIVGRDPRRLGQLRDRPLHRARVYDRQDSRWFKQEHLRRTQAFYDKYGGVTIIIGRFVPIVRTFAPFLAGVAGMSYRRFLSYNVDRRGAVDRLARLRGLPVRQHPVGEAEPDVDRDRHRRGVAAARRVDLPAGAARASRAAGSGLIGAARRRAPSSDAA